MSCSVISILFLPLVSTSGISVYKTCIRLGKSIKEKDITEQLLPKTYQRERQPDLESGSRAITKDCATVCTTGRRREVLVDLQVVCTHLHI